MTNTINERALSVMGNPEWAQNWALGGSSLFGEIMELATGHVWLTQQALSLEAYQALTPPEGFIKSGAARAVHDAAYFRRPPTADVDGPLETIDVDGVAFSFVAIPRGVDPEFDFARDGLLVLKVKKHHSAMFSKGRTLDVLSCREGLDYVPVLNDIAVPLPGMTTSSTAERRLPEGWSMRQVTLTEDLFVDIPCPAKVIFFADGWGFHGPLTLNL